jgi:hypothetical protein
MVRNAGRVRCVAQSSPIPSCEYTSSVLSRHCCYSFNLVLAETGIRYVCSSGRSYVRVLPQAGWRRGAILGSRLPVMGRLGLLDDLLHFFSCYRVADRRSSFVGLHDSVVAHGVSNFCAAFDVPRCTRKCIHFHLTAT